MTCAVLLSGGIDSYALTYERRPAVAITIDYGQKAAKAETEAARLIARRLQVRHEVITVDLRELGSGDLSSMPSIKLAPASDWWPFRNQMLVTLAAMKVIADGVSEILLGTVRSDAVHADGTMQFVALIDQLVCAQEGGIRVRAPAIELSSVELVRRSRIPFPLLAWSHSCHTGNLACGQCRGCTKQREVFTELGIAED